MTEPIRVAVAGYRGKVGSVLAAAFQLDSGIEYVGGVGTGDDLAAFLREKRPLSTTRWSRWRPARRRWWVPPASQPMESTSSRLPAETSGWAASSPRTSP